MHDNELKFTLPLLETPRIVRIRFRKVGNLQYISHLDLQRTFGRVLVRAGLPLWYTKGFNPHIKMVFGMPLPVGAESECEFLDVRLERDMSCEEVMRRLNAELTEELAVLAVYPAERKFAEIAFAEYEYIICTTGADEALSERIRTALASPLTIEKKGKAGVKTVSVSECIHRAEVAFAEGVITMRLVLSAGEGKYLSPESIITALRSETGILSGDLTKESYRILRRRALLADGETTFA